MTKITQNEPIQYETIQKALESWYNTTLRPVIPTLILGAIPFIFLWGLMTNEQSQKYKSKYEKLNKDFESYKNASRHFKIDLFDGYKSFFYSQIKLLDPMEWNERISDLKNDLAHYKENASTCRNELEMCETQHHHTKFKENEDIQKSCTLQLTEGVLYSICNGLKHSKLTLFNKNDNHFRCGKERIKLALFYSSKLYDRHICGFLEKTFFIDGYPTEQFKCIDLNECIKNENGILSWK